ncbi:MAG: Ribosomal large subunit pseudouridine synthase [Pseudomonadota bacterium]
MSDKKTLTLPKRPQPNDGQIGPAARPARAGQSRPQAQGAARREAGAADLPRRPVGDQPGARPAQQQRGPRSQGGGAGWSSSRPGQTGPAADRGSRPAQRPERRPDSRDASEPVRLNKRLSDLGLCSRREGDDWIERGWVKVNGQVAQMGQQVTALDRVEVAPQASAQQGARVTILLHKPIGYVSGLPEDGHESAAVLVQPRTRWKEDRAPRRFEAGHTRGLAPAGRLDIDSTGLLIMTQDGRVAKALIGEDSDVEKEYLVRVHWAPNGPKGVGVVTQNPKAVFPPERLELLRHGLSLDGQALRPAQVDWQNEDQLRFVLKEGKKRQIRRMCEQVGLHVAGLKRIRIGRVVLGNLPLGQWRYLGEHEKF